MKIQRRENVAERWIVGAISRRCMGLNFVVIKVGLHNMPPLMLAGLRFMLVAFPAIFSWHDQKYR